MGTYEKEIGDTLALVNVARMAFGKDILTELPDAAPGVTTDCLYYRALADIGCTGVGGIGMTFDDERKARHIGAIWGSVVEGNSVRHPSGVGRVIQGFDDNKLDHYNDPNHSPHF